jgi:hypothetical protein
MKKLSAFWSLWPILMIAILAQEEASPSGERLESKSLTASSQMAIKAAKNLMFPLKKWQRLDSESRELQGPPLALVR